MVHVEPMERDADSFEFALAAKKEALGPHITRRWGWDEGLQRKTHSERWQAKHFFRIIREGVAIGTVAIDDAPDHLRVGEFYLLSTFQGKGIGSEVLTMILRDADSKHLPVRLECLKWNPALRFYKRHGFVVTHESEAHFFMERPSR
ncbi:MAG: N-acetyltransferase [Betaproteobacteria bacterium]|nr:MAG: N-acetyltransferase [Betaproteobacteria bacterium]